MELELAEALQVIPFEAPQVGIGVGPVANLPHGSSRVKLLEPLLGQVYLPGYSADSDHTMAVAGEGILDINRHVLDGSPTKSLIKIGAGELVFLSSYNTYKNATHVQAGTLTTLAALATGDPTTSAMVVDEGATLNCQQQGFAVVGSLSGSGNVVMGDPGNDNALIVGQDNTSTIFSGVISGHAYVNKGARARLP
jgi:autotransporter-associated beta strand protein